MYKFSTGDKNFESEDFELYIKQYMEKADKTGEQNPLVEADKQLRGALLDAFSDNCL